MDLHQLRAFVTVAETENLTKAADLLFMTPPSVSAQIKALEEELKLVLFVRTSRGMKLTEAGARLKGKAEQTLRAAEAFIQQATALQTALSGQLTIGINATPGFLRIAPFAQSLKAEHPQVTLNFVNSSSGKILLELPKGTLDAGYIFGPVTNPTIAAVQVCVAELVVAAPKAWAERLRGANWADLAQMPWIGGAGYCPFQALVDELFRQKGLTYRRTVQADDEAIKCELISAGVGLALLEASEAQTAAQAGKMVIWAGAPIACPLSFAYPAQRADEPLLKAALAKILEVWGVRARPPLSRALRVAA
ncbi:MAG: LysR family transcriptional regulator [Caldilineaceae bacterium]